MLPTTSIGTEQLPDDGLGHRVSCHGTPEVARPRAVRDSGFERVEDAPASVGLASMFEEEGSGPDRPEGFVMPCPAMSGAESWTGSKSEGKRFSGSRLTEGAIPMDPKIAPP